jgi:hypothetical protein
VTDPITNTEDVIDSRQVIERIAELTEEYADAGNLGADEKRELMALRALAKEGEDYADWEFGAQLIATSYFEHYAEELAEDIGVITHGVAWPLSHIDWAAAAEELKADYTEIDFDGVPYLILNG